jgi:glycosyltransferase involved in cell wall biosynthesis
VIGAAGADPLLRAAGPVAVGPSQPRARLAAPGSLSVPRRALSVAMIVLDEEERIERTLAALHCADEVVVVDGGSSDRTREICRAHGCRVLERPFDDFGSQRRFAVGHCTHDWVLSLDADEVMSPELNASIRGLLDQPDIPEAAFRIEMQLVFLGRPFRFGKHARERHVRLFDRTRAGYDGLEVHEGVAAAGPLGLLPGRVVHHSFRDIAHFLRKMDDYTTRGARSLARRGRSRHPLVTLLAWPFYFVRSYLLQGNLLNGVPGLVWSFLFSLQPVIKYLKLDELGPLP